MKNTIKISIVIVLLATTAFACKSTKSKKANEPALIPLMYSQTLVKEISFPINTELFWGEAFNHPSFAIWMEDMEGNYVKTLFVTKSVASGIFGHGQSSDSTWSADPGKSFRPAALPVWFHKKGLLDDGSIVPTPEHPYIDAFVGATPTENIRLQSGTKSTPKSKFVVKMEINQTWDWNTYYHNNLYPNSADYKSSAQPSLIYAVTVDLESPFNEFHMHPIGHGHYAGANGLVYTDLSKHTTALKIVEKASIKIHH